MNTSNFIYPKELKEKIDRHEDFFLLDVREPSEHAFCSIPKSHLIPLKELPARYEEVDRSKEVVVYCRSGGRSGNAVEYLLRLGFERVKNLEGGILQWSDDVDPTIPKY